MARAWNYAYSDDPDDQEADHLQVEYRPGGTIEMIAVSDGAAVDLVGMPYAAFLDLVAVMGRFHQEELAEFCTMVPNKALAGLVQVAQYVSLGRRAVDHQPDDAPYPDSTARFALGELSEERPYVRGRVAQE